MDAPMAKGTLVQQVVQPFAGVITDVKFVADSLSFEYLVSNTDATGDTHERWFAASEITKAKK